MFDYFIREHLIFLMFQFLLVLFIMLLYWLDGFRNVDTAIYSIVISSILTFTFLGALFVKKYSFYKKILSVPTKMEVVLQREAQSPEIEQIEDIFAAYLSFVSKGSTAFICESKSTFRIYE